MNGPNDLVFSGPVVKTYAAAKELKAAGFKSTILDVPFAFYSSQVDSILNLLETAAGKVKYSDPIFFIVSTSLRELSDTLEWWGHFTCEGMLASQFIFKSR